MVWGYLHSPGASKNRSQSGCKRLVTLAVVLALALHLWLYNSLIVDTFYSAPAELAAGVIGARDPVTTIDGIWEHGGAVAGNLWNNGGVFSGDFGYYVAGALVWLFMGLLCVYAMFLIALSSVALAVLLALGPLFLALLLFDSTRRFFEAWLAQLANYALITVLTVMVAALLLQIVESYADQTAARGAAHCHRRRHQHGADRGARVPAHAPGHADRRGSRGRHRAHQLRDREPAGGVGHAPGRRARPAALALAASSGHGRGAACTGARQRRLARRLRGNVMRCKLSGYFCVWLLAGCAQRELRCDGPLEPINSPSVAAPAAAHPVDRRTRAP